MKSDSKNTQAIFIASFLTLIAAGVGFSVRGGGILSEWASQYGFTKGELGTITGGGLVGFGCVILLASMVADKVGYKPLMCFAFVLHILSAIIMLAATPIYNATGQNADAVYWCLSIGTIVFAVGNGVCEAVINPLVATLYPTKKTHYLNILHAGWPGGLILGAIIAGCFVGKGAWITPLSWEIPISLFIIPTLAYGYITLKNHFPTSEASAAGVDIGQMLKQFAAPVLLLLLVLHAMVGYVELGTDSWIVDIMGNVIPNAVVMLIYTSALMFVLRFFAGPIVERINPIGLLLISAILGCTGLLFLSKAADYTSIIIAATIYSLGKTFLWPTMLGVVGERFPKGGALTMGAMGGIGMLSAGLLGGPGIGYFQDKYASQHLEEVNSAVYAEYKAVDDEGNDAQGGFLLFEKVTGLDGGKTGKVKEKIDPARKGEEGVDPKNLRTADEQQVFEAGVAGGQNALRVTAYVPGIMAVGYLILLIYFRATGGYKAEHLEALDQKGNKPEDG